MTKEEALQAMHEGVKITHSHFTPNEFMTIDRGDILLEDGVRCSIQEFFRWRTGESWQDGYYLYEQKTPTP